jgi:hypothetical protein
MNVNADLLALGRHAVTGRVTPLLGRRTVTRLARIMVQPVDRAPEAPTMTPSSQSPRFRGLGRARSFKRLVQTRRIHPNLAVADPFEHRGDFLRGRKHEV